MLAAVTTRPLPRGVCLTLASLALLPLVGCQKIIGLEETYVQSGGPTSARCGEYCTEALDRCTGDDDGVAQLFDSKETCQAYCGAVDNLKVSTDADGETPLDCRLDRINDHEQAAAECRAGAPTGGRECAADTCATYCALFNATCCADKSAIGCKAASKDCERKCGTLRDEGTYDFDDNYEDDSLQCRFLHLISAIKGDTSHCGHAAFNANARCFDVATDDLTCADYCRAVDGACPHGGDDAEYDSAEQCTKACEALAVTHLGKNRDYRGNPPLQPVPSAENVPNTIGCRKDHAGFAFDDTFHCAHAGPVSGEGHCGQKGTECDSFCTLRLASKCDPTLTMDACIADCGKVPANYDGYEVKNATDGTFDCRVHQVLRALTLTGAEKDAACAMVAAPAASCQAP